MTATRLMMPPTPVASATSRVSVTDLSVSYPGPEGAVKALDQVTIEARSGEFVSIIGPSGCGKSTLLRAIAGLLVPNGGRVDIDGRNITGHVGDAAYMPQKDLLMDWKTVLDNVCLPLELRGFNRKRARLEALQHFKPFGLEGFENNYPSSLSGGMRQRAALLRTYLVGRDVLLLDEPFGSLDALTRSSMHEWLSSIRQVMDKSVILVTHDVDEAICLSDRIYVFSSRPGRVLLERELHPPGRMTADSRQSAIPVGGLRSELLLALKSELR